MAANLYAFSRSIFSNLHIQNDLWFVAVSKGMGYRLIDVDMAKAVFDNVAPHAHKFGRSTLEIGCEVFSTALPYEKLLMRQAIGENKCLELDVSQAGYKKDGSTYTGAMMALYGRTSFVIYPILVEGPVFAVALFSARYREQVEPMLNEHRSELANIIKNSCSQVRKTLALLKKVKLEVEWGKVGQFVGGFVGSLIQSLQGP